MPATGLLLLGLGPIGSVSEGVTFGLSAADDFPPVGHTTRVVGLDSFQSLPGGLGVFVAFPAGLDDVR